MNKITGIVLLLLYIFVATALISPNFVKPSNLTGQLGYVGMYGIMGIGAALVIITGGIDLSIGSLIGLVGCILPILLNEKGWSAPSALMAVVVLSLFLGFVHGVLITKARLQPFIVTLCGLLIYRGLARWITEDQSQGFGSEYEETLRLLANGRVSTVPCLILLAGIYVLLRSSWHWWRISSEQRKQPGQLSLTCVGAAIGLTLIVVGSSRYWMNASFSWHDPWMTIGQLKLYTWEVTVKGSQTLPERLMSNVAWGAVPGLLWLMAVTVPRQPARIIPPLIGAAITCWALVFIVQQDPDKLQGNLRIAAVFGTLAAVMACLGWTYRAALNAVGSQAKAPLLLTAFCGLCGLAGEVKLGETFVEAPFYLLLVIAILTSIFLNQTIYGRYLFALGRNPEAARYSGIQTDRMVILAYVLCSGIAGVAGIVFALDLGSIQPSGHGNFFELYAIAAAVLGGCSLRGGEGSVVGVIIGAAVMRMLYNSINILKIPSQLEFTIIGVVILAGVLADEYVKRIAAQRRSSTV